MAYCPLLGLSGALLAGSCAILERFSGRTTASPFLKLSSAWAAAGNKLMVLWLLFGANAHAMGLSGTKMGL